MNPSKLSNLLEQYLEGSLSPEERSELQSALLEDVEAREQFWREAQMHGMLRLLGEQESGARVAREDLKIPAESTVVGFPRKVWMGAAAAAVVALLLIGFGPWSSEEKQESSVAGGESVSPEIQTTDTELARPKLSERLFADHKPRFSSERVTSARDRVRQLRDSLTSQPTLKL
ncbi:MAG: hypothetical protein AAF733_08030 [Verrucomicrobiota bacterium]